MKVLVLGGYGNFGARICRALKTEPQVELLVAGRSESRAREFARTLGKRATGIAVDVDTGFANTLRALAVELVIHTAGPFQAQGYAIAEATAAAGAHYIDLSDGRRFVCDFPLAMDKVFRSAGRTAISGASTVPALSSAVVGHLCEGWQRIESIDICIAPAQSAPRGGATIAAVLSYCGEKISVWENGQWRARRGWAHPQAVTFARMRPRIGALCDIPDLELFPTHFGVAGRVMFRAALEVKLTQWGFATLATARMARLIPNPSRFARLLTAASPMFDRLGTQLGGMVVRTAGLDAVGRPVHRAWHIAADNDHGPEIPCMAAIVLARRLAAGGNVPVGAHTGTGLLALSEFEPEFAKWGMVIDTIEEA
ncbi:saccharopine dehydrogenase NADP-binding domain-containing protein [Variovorax humicola]|uniref:Saccharopine dehydrogenase NADP-binding domain-containing protein n=1 Tax=Variovorax humicola TaxID=1769758 RepID=A0ABU8VYU6_9BURK